MEDQNENQQYEDNLDNPEESSEQTINVVAEKAEFEEFDEATLKSNISNERLNLLRDLQLNVFI